MIPLIFLFGDTPKWLYSKGKYFQLFNTLSKISRVNGNYHNPEQMWIICKLHPDLAIPVHINEDKCNICCNNIKNICKTKDLRYNTTV